MRRRIARRLTGRAWHWARRRRGRGFASAEFWRHVQSLLALGDAQRLIDGSCASFVGTIRVPPTDRPPPVLPVA